MTTQAQKIEKILELLQRIDVRTSLTEQTVAELEERVATQNGRVTKLERIGLMVGGGAAAMLALYGLDVSTIVAKLLGG